MLKHRLAAKNAYERIDANIAALSYEDIVAFSREGRASNRPDTSVPTMETMWDVLLWLWDADRAMDQIHRRRSTRSPTLPNAATRGRSRCCRWRRSLFSTSANREEAIW